MNLGKFLTDFLEEKEEKCDKGKECDKKAKGWECECGGRLLKNFKTGGKWCTKCKTKYPKSTTTT